MLRTTSTSSSVVEPVESTADRARIRVDAGVSIGGGFAEALYHGGGLIAAGLHIRLGVQVTDLIAIMYEATGTFGGWPGACFSGDCQSYSSFIHTSGGLIDFTIDDWFQVGLGGVAVLGSVAEHYDAGLGIRARLAYVGGGGSGRRGGFMFSTDAMLGRFPNGCPVYTTHFSLGYAIY